MGYFSKYLKGYGILGPPSRAYYAGPFIRSPAVLVSVLYADGLFVVRSV